MPKKYSIILISFLLLPIQSTFADESNFRQFIDSQTILEAGIRQDQLDWNIAGNIFGDNPNILSELTWKDLEIYQIKTGGLLIFAQNNPRIQPCLRGRIDYGWIVAGDNQDSDYDGDNRSLEYSRSNNKSDDGSVFDASLAFGLRFKPIPQANLFITPLLGLSYHEQNLVITDGNQTLSKPPQLTPLGPIAGLDSTYEAQWRSGWLGADLEWNVFRALSLNGSAEYHVGTYRAEANWNLRTDLNHPVSFRHKSDNAKGYVLSTGAKLRLQRLISLHLDVSYQKWCLDDDPDTTNTHTNYLSTGTSQRTRLNEVNWESQAVLFGFTIDLL